MNRITTRAARRLALSALASGLLLCPARAQLYYIVSDGTFTTTLDELRRTPLTSGSETTLTNNIAASPNFISVDFANNRVFVADVRSNMPRIYTVSLTSPYTVTLFLTPAAIPGATTSSVAGLAVDKVNHYLYYVMNDGSFSTTLDELRRCPLSNPTETTLASNFISSPGQVAVDLPNNRVLVADVRSNVPKIVAVSTLSPYSSSTFLSPAAIPSASNTAVAGIAVDNVNNYLYYMMNDGTFATTLDEPRRTPLSGAGGETTLRNNFISSPGTLAMDVPNNRVFVADVRNNVPQIAAVSTQSPYNASVYLTPAALSGSANTAVAGIATVTASYLPLKLLAFEAAKGEGGDNRIAWEAAAEQPGTTYELSRSLNNTDFEVVARLAGTGARANYSYADAAPQAPTVWYRLQATEAGGEVAYSNSIAVKSSDSRGGVSICPQPAGGFLTIRNTDETLNGRDATVIDAQGRLIKRFTISSALRLDVSGWAAGCYSLHLPSGKELKVVKQ